MVVLNFKEQNKHYSENQSTAKPIYITKFDNGELFHKKLEPLKLIHSILGLRSYEFDGVYFRKISSFRVSYLFFLSVSCVVVYFNSLKIAFIAFNGITIHSVISCLVKITGAIQTTCFFFSHVNCSAVINIFKNFDIIEKNIPNVNGFLHKSNILNVVLHSSNILFVVSHVIAFQFLYFGLYEINIFDTVITDLTYFYYIINDFSVYQCCIVMNMIGSYCNMLNISTCKMYNTTYEQSDTFMMTIKNNVLQYSSVEQIKDLRFNHQNTEHIIKNFERLMHNLELANRKYNIIVSTYQYNTNLMMMKCLWFFRFFKCITTISFQLLFGPFPLIFHLIAGIPLSSKLVCLFLISRIFSYNDFKMNVFENANPSPVVCIYSD